MGTYFPPCDILTTKQITDAPPSGSYVCSVYCLYFEEKHLKLYLIAEEALKNTEDLYHLLPLTSTNWSWSG